MRWSSDLSFGRPRSAAATGAVGGPIPPVVIALGTAVETKAGWRLRLDHDDLSEPLADPAEARHQRLLAPEQIARRFPLVVLVRPPSGDHPAVDGQSSDGLRGLANEIFLAGAHAVVTVPTLPSSLATEALRCLMDDCESWTEPPDERRLVNCARQMRSSIYEGLGELGPGSDWVGREKRIELALDVCLFGPGRR